MANETTTTTTTRAPRAPRATAATATAGAATSASNGNALTGKSIDELATIGTPAAMQRIADIIKASGISNSAVSSGNDWGNGILYGTYTDCLKEDKTPETFLNKAGEKVAGRYIKDMSGRRVKFYNTYLRLLPEGLAGTKVVESGAESILLINGAKFGIKATPDADNRSEYQGKMYAGTVHSYADKKFEQPTPVAPIDKEQWEKMQG